MIPPVSTESTARILDALPVDDYADSVPPLRIHTPPPARPVNHELPEPPSAGGMKPLAYLKYHWVMVVFLGGILGSILAAVAWNLLPAKYTTTSIVRVNPDVPVVYLPTDVAQGSNSFGSYLKTQAGVFRTHLVLHSALSEPGIAQLPMLRSQTDPVKFLEDEVLIETQEGSELVKLKLSGEDPKAIAQILNAIQRVYFREIIEKELTIKKFRLKELGDEVLALQKDLGKLHDDLKKSKPAETVNDPADFLGMSILLGQVLRYQELQAKLDTDVQLLQLEKVGLEKRMQNLEEEVPHPGPMVVDQLDKDPHMLQLVQENSRHQKRIDYLKSLNENNPAIDELVQKMKANDDKREKFKQEKIAEYRKSHLPVVEKTLKAALDQCNAKLLSARTIKEQNEKITKEYQSKMKKTGDKTDSPPSLIEVKIEKQTNLLKSMVDKQKLLDLEIRAPARVTEFQTAAVPQKKDMKKQILATIVAGLMGFGLVGLMAVVYESRVKRAMSLPDVQQSVLGPILGVVPYPESNPSGELIDEAISKLQSAIAQQYSQQGTKVIVVTSALKDEGKAFISGQLAAGMTRTGSRTLLIDFDLRTPSLHALLKVPNDAGLCEVLRGEQDLSNVVKVSEHGMMMLPAGKWNPLVRTALQVDRLSALFLELQQHCDNIVIHTHPILNVAETSLISQFADAVLLCVEKYESRLPMVTRAHEKIAALSPESLGIVFVGASEDECLN
jgi:capsular exopolysaccharide synthesis family protein